MSQNLSQNIEIFKTTYILFAQSISDWHWAHVMTPII